MPLRVLILCTGNSARSQMAEGLLRHLGGARYDVYSAGTHPTIVNPLAIAAMAEIGIDISGHRSKSVNEFRGQPFDYVITVCDNAATNCQAFPSPARRIHWSFPDPAAVTGSDAERLQAFSAVRDAIAARLQTWLPQPILHDSVIIARQIAASPPQVFAAFADISVRQRWFWVPGSPGIEAHDLDLRIGGEEMLRGRIMSDGVTQHFVYCARFLDVIEPERIVYTYDLILDGIRRSVSLVTIELTAEGDETILAFTEQFALLHYTADGHDDIAERKGGMQFKLNGLIATLQSLG